MRRDRVGRRRRGRRASERRLPDAAAAPKARRDARRVARSASLRAAARRLRRRARLPQAGASRCRSRGSSRRRGAKARPDDARRQGPVVAALRRSAARRARSSRRSPQARRSRSPAARLAQARALVGATSAALLPQVSLATRGLAPAHLGQPAADATTRRRTSRRCRTTSSRRSRSATRSTSPAGCSARSKARAPRPSSPRPTSRTRGCCSTTDLATAYFNLRAIDIELDVLARSIALQRRALELRRRARHDLGAVSGLDVAQQQALLDTHADPGRRAAAPARQFEHAIATLTGTPAPLFALAPDLQRARAAGGAARRAVRRARAPARRRLGRARDGGRQRADRRRHARRSIRASRSAPQLGVESRVAGDAVRCAEPALVDRRLG